MTAESWLTKAEIAAELKVSVRTVERYHLPAMRVGGQNRYRRSEVERFLRVGGQPAMVVELHPQPSKGTAA
jgi:excisionase family DNA binding protein